MELQLHTWERHTTLLRKILLVSITLSMLIACSGGGGGGANGGHSPSLNSISVSPDSAAAGLTIDFSGNFVFTDPDGDLDGGYLNYTYEGTTYSILLPPELKGITSATVYFTLLASLSSSTGTMDIPFWLVDGAGNSSNVVHGTFTQLWTRQFGTMFEDIGNGIAIDHNDDVLIAGTTYGDLDGETNLGVSDVFITKYAAGTTRIWTKLIGSDSTDNGRAVAIDGNNNIFISGDTIGTSFDGQVPVGPLAGFLSKFGPSGNRVWTRLISNTSGASAYAVATDSNNNIYVAGRITGDLDDQTNAGGYDAFLVKYDTNGNRQWARLLGTGGSETAYGMTTDSSGNIYLTGSTDGVLGTDPSPGDPIVNFDAFVAKYTTNGTLQWVTQLGTSCSEWSKDIAVDGSGNIFTVGKIYTCAFASNTASGGYDAFLGRLDASGNFQWVKQLGTADHDSANGVTADSSGNAYVTGYLDSVYFTDDNEGDNIFLAKYDSSGTQTWLTQESASYSWGNQGRAVTANSSDHIFLTGTIHSQLDGHTNPNYGEDDVFILKYDTSGVRR